MSNLFPLNLAGMCGNCFGLRGQFQQISRIKTEISLVSIFSHGNRNFPMHEGVLLIPFNYQT
jgi:aconitase A